MKIAIKAAQIAPGGGLTHLNKVIEWFGKIAPQTEFVLLGKDGQQRLFAPAPSNFEYIYYRFPSLSLPAQLFWERQILPGVLRQMQADLLFEPGNRGTLKSPIPKVSLIHNIAPFDDQFRSGEKTYKKLRLSLLNRATVESIKASQGVIFISKFSRDILAPLVDLGQVKSTIIYHGKTEIDELNISEDTFKRQGIVRPYILCVSDIKRYKKIYEMVESYLRALSKEPSLPSLVIAGANHAPEYFREIIELIRLSGHDSRVVFTGQIPRAEVLALYQNCEAFLFPSVIEACPNILIEALSFGCPMATSDRGVMPEIAGDAAAYFNPDDINDFSEKIITVVKDSALRSELRQKALERAYLFSWEKTARQTLDFFDEVLGIKNKIVAPAKIENKRARCELVEAR